MDPNATRPPSAPPASTEPTGHYGPGYGDLQPVDPDAARAAAPGAAGEAKAGDAADAGQADDRHAAYRRWREERLREMDTAYTVWCETGETCFPDDFDAWRHEHHELVLERSAAGIAMAAAGEDAPRTTKTMLLFERS
jgi:hypothetical protein